MPSRRSTRLRAAFVTPQKLLYVRSHGDIPDVDAASHRISVEGLVSQPSRFSVDELKHRFAPHTVRAVMQCAGNRRADMRHVRPVLGDPWAGGAIGHAEWTGVALRDVLGAAGCRDGEASHVAFEALDIATDREGPCALRCLDPACRRRSRPDVLLAPAMNGEELAPEHGFPLRVVVPGFAGVRSPKWLARIVVQDAPSEAFQQAEDYKLFPPDMREETQDLARGITIDEMPLNSTICVPSPGVVTSARPGTLFASRPIRTRYQTAQAPPRPSFRDPLRRYAAECSTRATVEVNRLMVAAMLFMAGRVGSEEANRRDRAIQVCAGSSAMSMSARPAMASKSIPRTRPRRCRSRWPGNLPRRRDTIPQLTTVLDLVALGATILA